MVDETAGLISTVVRVVVRQREMWRSARREFLMMRPRASAVGPPRPPRSCPIAWRSASAGLGLYTAPVQERGVEFPSIAVGQRSIHPSRCAPLEDALTDQRNDESRAPRAESAMFTGSRPRMPTRTVDSRRGVARASASSDRGHVYCVIGSRTCSYRSPRTSECHESLQGPAVLQQPRH